MIANTTRTLPILRGRRIAFKTLTPTTQNQIFQQPTRRFKRTSISKKDLNQALQKRQSQNSMEEIFGLKPVDFTIVPPVYGSPPPPPPKPGFQKYLFPLSVFVTLGITAYFYFNNENDSKEYWEAMQTGGVLPGTYDDDDDDDDDDDFEDEDEE